MKRPIYCILGFLVFLWLPGQGSTMSERQQNSEMAASGLDPQAVYWYERGVKKQAWMSTDEVAVFQPRGRLLKADEHLLAQQFHPEAVVTSKNEAVIFLKVPKPVGKDILMNRLANIRSLPNIRQACPVFYRNTTKTPDARMVLTGDIIVRFPSEFTESRILAIEEEYGLKRLKSFDFSPNAFLYRSSDPLTSLDVANRLYESGQVKYAYPNWLRKRAKKYRPTDALYNQQWHLENSGQGSGTVGEDVNIISTWDIYRGSENEIIAIVDDGLEIVHADLADNIIDGLSWDYVGNDSDPTPEIPEDKHGTACAGVAAGRGDNSQGVAGAAFLTGLVGHRLLGNDTDANEADALTRNNHQIDIYSNSWGPPDGSGLVGPGDLTEDALENGTTHGRGGRGNIYVFAGGNGGLINDNSNYDGYSNSRFTIAVAASDNNGKRSWYSDKGANIVVNAPSDGGTLGITTTDLTGSYRTDFGGTSSACPLVAGIVALMLEANPNLTWRDVQHILITTAEKNDPADTDWTTNGAGYHVNHKYGFGRIDAQAAVIEAASWPPVAGEKRTEAGSAPNLPIPDDNPIGVTDKISISEDIDIEFVEIYFSATDHKYWGDLEITLISPEGTESVLSEKHFFAGNNAAYNNWRFGSVRHFGESSQGDWTLKVKDLLAPDTGTFQSWTLKIYGTFTSIASEEIEYFVTRFYVLCLGRSPDPAGLMGWVYALLDGSQTGSDVAYGVVFSTEFLNKNTTHEEFLWVLYEALFDRSPDAAGFQTWLNALNSGVDRKDVLNGFIYAAEFEKLCDQYDIKAHPNHHRKSQIEGVGGLVTRFYLFCLDRNPDPAGLDGWTNDLLNQVKTGADVARGFIYSQEFANRGTNNGQYLAILYKAFFNREPDQAGWDFWLAELNVGKNRGYVLDEFLGSPEFSKLSKDFGIIPY